MCAEREGEKMEGRDALDMGFSGREGVSVGLIQEEDDIGIWYMVG